jgi:hypothetical protein
MPRCYFDVKSGIDWWTRLESIAPVTAKPNNRPGLLRLRLHGTIAQDDCTGRAGVNDKAQGLGNPPGRQRSYSNKSW